MRERCPLYPQKRTFSALGDVRLVPIADIARTLFDQLIGTSKQLTWYLEAKRLCSRQIDE